MGSGKEGSRQALQSPRCLSALPPSALPPLLAEVQDVLQLSKLADDGALKAELMLRVACTKIALDKRKAGDASEADEPKELAATDPKKLIAEAEAIAKSLPARKTGFQLTWGLVLSTALAAISYICSQIGGPIVA